MLKRWSSSKIGLLTVATVSAAAVFVMTYSLPSRMENRVYRIGVDNGPPLTEIQEDGKPIGLAVELINEAARRRHIVLEWVPTDIHSRLPRSWLSGQAEPLSPV